MKNPPVCAQCGILTTDKYRLGPDRYLCVDCSGNRKPPSPAFTTCPDCKSLRARVEALETALREALREAAQREGVG